MPRRAALAAACAALVVSACSKPPLKPAGVIRLSRARVVAVTTVLGPSAPASTKRVTIACPSGTTVAGGGMAGALVGGATPPSSLHADGSAPVTARGSVPSGWMALGATGGQLVLGGVTTSYAMCLHGAPFGRPKVVVATVPGPNVAATTARATAACPSGETVLGGGGLATVTSGSPSPSMRLIGSYPSDARGAQAGSTDPAAWSAIADSGGRTGTRVQTSAFAICVRADRARVEVARATRPGPLPPGSATPITAACPAGTELVSGGAKTGPASGGTPQQGLHLTGTFPSTAAGGGVGSSAAAENANAWTARAESGGQGSPAGTVTTAFAICLRG